MKSLSLILRIVAIVAACGAAVLFFMAQGKIKEKDAQLKAATAAHETTQAELAEANTEIAQLSTSIAQGRSALAESKRELDTTRSEMYAAQQEVTRTQTQLKQAQQQVSSLQLDLQTARSQLIEAESKAAQVDKTAEIAALNSRIQELETANQELQDDLNVAKSKVDALSARGTTSASTYGTSTPSSGATVGPVSIGPEVTIASISLKDGIVVFDQGADLGLAPGTQVTLIKDMKAVGKVRIVQVKDQYTVANILPGAKTSALTAGTAVKLLR